MDTPYVRLDHIEKTLSKSLARFNQWQYEDASDWANKLTILENLTDAIKEISLSKAHW